MRPLALASEVGDGTPSRRGRAQQILVLQQKLLELQDQLKGRQRGQNGVWFVSAGGIERRDGDGRAAAALRQLERDRRCKHEQACQQLESTAAQLEAARGREGACRARARTLEAELACSRGQLSSLLQRDRSHDRRLAELADQLSAVEKKLSEKQQEIQNLERSWQAEKQTLMQDIIKKNAKIEELQSYLVTKNISAETPREEARSSTDTTAVLCRWRGRQRGRACWNLSQF
ncbi:uncharacterized protein LOC134528268 [Bacillus rossius redtenbacheri]|uniref:uncharacterized protein LOC134528268 n=1 Tax=Bacillus rossius redtenbacheri TaxID=93214 RepID=UPI002FDEB2CC